MEFIFLFILFLYSLNLISFLRDSMTRRYIYVPTMIFREDKIKEDNIKKLLVNSFAIEKKLKELEIKLSGFIKEIKK